MTSAAKLAAVKTSSLVNSFLKVAAIPIARLTRSEAPVTGDNFGATIVSAVRQGRVLYDNILKFVGFQLSTTIGPILTVFLASLAGDGRYAGRVVLRDAFGKYRARADDRVRRRRPSGRPK